MFPALFNRQARVVNPHKLCNITAFCERCGASAEAIEDGWVPPDCPYPDGIASIKPRQALRAMKQIVEAVIEASDHAV